ncbi:Endonuclease/exonuclease/phosphatase, partial [Mycena polygramma]
MRPTVEEVPDDDDLNQNRPPPNPNETEPLPDSNQPNNIPQPNRRARRAQALRSKKNTKAAIRFASLNMKGYGNPSSQHKKNKWNHINQVVREKRLGILVVQETHMTEERKAKVEKLFAKRLKIFISSDPDNPTGKGGIAVVLNRELTNTSNVKTWEVVPGRAMLAQTNWHRGETVTFLAVYAPNVPEENKTFWLEINLWFENHPTAPKPDMMAGDFNIVQDGVDRLPTHEDSPAAVDALDELAGSLQLYDGWRETYPSTKAFTFCQSIANGSHSRIDRIYISEKLYMTAREWKIEAVGIPTDHKMVSVQIAHEDAPSIGKKRWSIPVHLLSDKILAKSIRESGEKALKTISDLNGMRTHDVNPQTIWANFKSEITEVAKAREKAIVPKIIQQQRKLEAALKRVTNSTSTEEKDKIPEAVEITAKIHALEIKRHSKVRSNTAINSKIHNETLSREWTQTNKERKPRDMIYALRKPGALANDDQIYEKDSRKMAELARNYHNDLQVDEIEPDPELRAKAITEVLENIETRTTESQFASLQAQTTEKDVTEALLCAQNNRAAGIDGLIYELWKTVNARYLEDERSGRPSFNIIQLMTMVFNDIRNFGVEEQTKFTEGWMAPFYKKNDRNDISNYRPITLLNTDYKLFTKVLAIKL